MKKFKDLTTDDFPGMDAEKITQWKEAVMQMNRNWSIGLIVLVAINIVLYLATRSLMLGGIVFFIIMFFVNQGPSRTARVLQKELGLTRAVIMKARKRATS